MQNYKRYFLRISQSLLIVMLVASAAFSQVSEDEKNGLLPDIESQNIEIRGEFKARFPGLKRQPILGFNPTLRVYQFPGDRIPYMETGKNAVAEIALSPFSQLAGPIYNTLPNNELHYLYAQLGFGSFTSPEGHIWSALPVSDQAYLGLDLDFSSSQDGHLAYRPSDYRYFTGSAEFGVQLNETVDLYIFAGMQNDFNYAARFNRSNTNNGFDNIARIEYEGIHAGVELSGYKNEVTGWKLNGNIRTFNSAYKTSFWPGKVDEMVYDGSFTYQWALGHPSEVLKVKLNGRGGTYETDNKGEQQWYTLFGGVAYERLFNYTTRLYAEGDVYYVANFAESKALPGGKVSVSQWVGNRLKISGEVEAKPVLRSFENFYEQNRFLGYNNELRHSYAIHVNGEAQIKWYRGSRLYGGVTYMNTQDYAYFTPQSNSATGSPPHDFYSITYGDVTNMKIYAGIVHQLSPDKFWLNARVYVQNPILSNDNPIPYSESWGLDAGASYRPVERITIKGWAKYLGDRTAVNIPNTASALDDILLVGGQLNVRIVDGIGAYVKVLNLLDQEYRYWQGYLERPLQLYGGITITL